MNNVYKINYIKNNKTEKLIIFLGESLKYNDVDLNQLLLENPDDEIIKSILTDDEIYDIQQYKIDVVFVLNYLHLDDTIESIKFKIIEALNYEISFEEIYLFCKKKEVLNSTNLFQKLTRNGKLDLTRNKLISFLLNYEKINFDILPDKDIYTYEDLTLLNLDNKSYILNKFIGQHLVTLDVCYTANPYNILTVDSDIEDNIDHILSTTNKNLLLDYGSIINNTIYLCLAEDVLESSDEKKLDSNLILQLYFYFLHKKEITNLQELKQRKQELLIASKKKIEKEYILYNSKVNLFHSIYHEKTNKLKYVKEGIKSIDFVINAKLNYNLPLEMIFKFLNTTEKLPFMKFNPGIKQENIFRLYAPDVDKNKNKIPLINRGKFIKIDKTIGKRKRTSFYIIDNNEHIPVSFFCEFDNKGNVYIHIDFTKPTNILKIEQLIKTNINPILKSIKNKFDDNGYIIELFSSFEDKNIEIIDLNLNMVMELKHSINLTKYIGCLGSVFDVFEKNIKKGIKLSFKRVSNYNKMDGEETFIINLLKQHLTDNEIITEIKTNLSLSIDDSKMLFAKVISNLQIVRNLDENRVLKIKTNPGFKILINKIPFKSQISINIHNINNIIYLKTVPIYIDSLIRLNENIQSTKISNHQIKEVCKIKMDEVKGIVDEKTSVTEQSFLENEIPTEIQLDDDDDDILDLMLDSSDEELESETETDTDTLKKGGASSDPSLSDISLKSLHLTSSEESSSKKDEDAVESEKDKDEDAVESEKDEDEDAVESEKDEDEDAVESEKAYISKSSIIDDGDSSESDSDSDSDIEDGEHFQMSRTPIDIKKKTLLEQSISNLTKNSFMEKQNVESISDEISMLSPFEVDKENQSILLFNYGSNNIEQLRYRTKNPNLVSNKGFIRNYIRIFAGKSKRWQDGAVASLKEKKDQICKGTYVKISAKELELLDKYEGIIENVYYKKRILIETSNGEKLKGLVYVKYNNTWEVHPSIQYIKTCIKTIISFWAELDEHDEYIVKDETFTIRGVYNLHDDQYIKYDEGELKEREEKEEEEEEEEEEISMDVVGENLGYPNPFSKRLEEREPALFYKSDKKDKAFSAYSRICPWNIKRQPIILTQQEKKRIDKEHPDSYGEFLTYGSDPDKQFHYACPRYWSLKYDTSLTEEAVKSGKYGNIIPSNSKKVPADANIFEFTDPKYHTNKDGKYKQLHPGFLKKPGRNGLCIPCCFGSKNKAFKERKEECKQEPHGLSRPMILKRDSSMKRASSDIHEVLLGPDKFPLEPDRWGYLPFSIQKFLDIDNTDCQKTKKNPALKLNHPCIVRKGIEINDKQSFIGCIADLYVYQSEESIENIPSIKEMKDIIIQSLTLDQFVSLNNGNLVQIFSKNKKIDISKYTDSVFYKKTIKNNPEQVMNAAESFENFISFLEDDDTVIDHTYLWDIISNKNNIFKNKNINNGINIIILEIVNDDVTENINILCPTNYFSSTFFDDDKPTFILFKNENYYEPIYVLTDKKTHLVDKKLFYFKEKNLLPDLKQALTYIKRQFDLCTPVSNKPKSYNFKSNIIPIKIMEILTEYNYIMINQIINHNNKVIGIVVEKQSTQGYIPCYPSAINGAFDYTHVEEYEWKNYKDTIDFLIRVYKECSGKINCLPKIKILEDGLVVGILTETNQLIPLIEPEENVSGDELDEVSYNNYLIADKTSFMRKEKDNDRIEFVKKIKLENDFYQTFRLNVKRLLTQYTNIENLKNIDEIIHNKILTYKTQLINIKKIIKDIIKDKIEFSEYDDRVLLEINEITDCLSESADCSKKIYCVKTDEMNCKFVIPDINLLSGKNNESLYLNRICDELIRYNRIKTFFDPSKISLFKEQNYNLNDDEILLLQSLIGVYYDKLSEKVVNNYKNTFDDTNPISNKILETKKKDKVGDNDDLEEKIVMDCIKSEKSITGNWGKVLPVGSKEIHYKESINCTYNILIDILKEYDEITYRDISIRHIKDLLIQGYQSFKDIIEKLMKLLISEGKSHTVIKKILSGKMTIQNFITNEEYYITNLDIIVLCCFLNIPLVIYSSSINKSNKLLTFNSNNYSFFIKMQFKTRDHILSSFRLVKYKSFYKIKHSDLKNDFSKLIAEKQLNINEYVEQQTNILLHSTKKITTQPLSVIP